MLITKPKIVFHNVKPLTIQLTRTVFKFGFEELSIPDPDKVANELHNDRLGPCTILISGSQSCSEILSGVITSGLASGQLYVVQVSNGTVSKQCPTSPRFFLVDGQSDDSLSDFIRICFDIRTSLILNDVQLLTGNLINCYETLYDTEPDHRKRVHRYLTSASALIGAGAIAIFTLDTDLQTFSVELSTDNFPIDSVPRSYIEDKCTFLDGTATFSGQLTLDSIPTLSKSTLSSRVAIFTFKLFGVPGFVLFSLENAVDGGLVWYFCSYVAREIYHLLRSRELRSQYDTLKALTEINPLQSDPREVLWQMLSTIKKHFGVDGVSLLECIGEEHDKLTFLKTYLHYGRCDEVTFTASHGFAHRSIVGNKALILERIVDDGCARMGIGIELEPTNLRPEAALTVKIPAILAPNTSDHEMSVMYFPLKHPSGINAVIKVGSFDKEKAFGFRQLRTLAVFGEPLANVVAVVRSIRTLQLQIENQKVEKNMSEQAEALFFYREISLGVFHQVGNHLNSLAASLALLDAVSVGDADAASAISQCEQYVRLAKDLIRGAQHRGQTLKPQAKQCLLVQDVVRPAIEYEKKRLSGSVINLQHTLTSSDYEVELDPELAKESIINLLENARWAVKENTANSRKDIRVAVRQDELIRVRIEISDTGIGMDRDLLSRLAQFPPFVTTRQGGTGLGLYFAHKLFTFFGGQMSIERSQGNKGTTISVILPIHGAK